MTVSSVVEIPESVHSAFQEFLATCPDWDHDRVISAALSLFLLQNQYGKSTTRTELGRTYLDSLFKRPVDQL